MLGRAPYYEEKNVLHGHAPFLNQPARQASIAADTHVSLLFNPMEVVMSRSSLLSLSVTYRGSSTQTCSLRLSMLNHQTATWDPLGTASPVGNTEVAVVRPVTGSPSDYVSASGVVKVRVRCTNLSPSFTLASDMVRMKAA